MQTSSIFVAALWLAGGWPAVVMAGEAGAGAAAGVVSAVTAPEAGRAEVAAAVPVAPVVPTAAAADATGGAAPAQPAAPAGPAQFAGLTPLPAGQLAQWRGGAGGVTNDMTLNGAVTGNNAVDVATGANLITNGAFSNASGLSTAIQNSGANVLIQNATIINIQLQ